MAGQEIELVRDSPERLRAFLEGDRPFEAATGTRPADGLRQFYEGIPPEYFEHLLAADGADLWSFGFSVALPSEGLVVGTVGFKGTPGPEGRVEIAYAIAPGFQGRGFATGALQAAVREVAATGEVNTICAHTLPNPNASTRVLEKCGFTRTGESVDPDDGLVWRWERAVGVKMEPGT